MRKNLGFWPPFPIAIYYICDDDEGFTPNDKDSLFAALEHPDRVCRVDLCLTGPQLTEVATLMQEPLPALTHLSFRWEDLGRSPPAIPRGFLGGSAPCLQYLHLEGIPFPALLALVSSTSNLVVLHLDDIPQGGYLSPEAMVACLTALHRLKYLSIEFHPNTPRPDQIPPPPVARTLLPALTSFRFRGVSEYLEGLVSRIDSPQLSRIDINYYLTQFFDFQVAQLFKFIDRSEDPRLTLNRHAEVIFSSCLVTFEMYPCPETKGPDRPVSVWSIAKGLKDKFRT